MAAELDGTHDLVVIGASAGGVETLTRVVAGLPSDLPATVCIVVHIAPSSPSALGRILSRSGPLPCHAAVDGDPLRPGEILVAPPDRHLVIEDGRVRLTVGPTENGHRPAIDVLFRSAADALEGRVVGVVLSGTRDDGTAGLALIKARGGGTIVQDPSDALYPGMPASALANVTVDAIVPSERVAGTIEAMVRGEKLPLGTDPSSPIDDPEETGAVAAVCPACGGVLTEQTEAGVTQWLCRVGHRYSPTSLSDAQAEGVEAALWAAIRALEDRAALLQRMADKAGARGQDRSARSFRRRAETASEQAVLVREALSRAAATTLRKVVDGGSAGVEDEEEVAS
jgi:two-component system chemotaxis response regulator CheB